ncbi:MAG: FAD-dependent thymidylate synthase [Candidatus Micrarchaeota archaeon]|nr:FAD-dependent thymidylate synthase [Candidatus Micrarchaeota archaeon]MDE1823945.1 FAD-dependent thymidylate synthase [Candidatus Micrarchaeota archaeon]MDE1849161.1 FAD-dependent thymidylate synthase [Candidatus Micrarchaeota archaeon]
MSTDVMLRFSENDPGTRIDSFDDSESETLRRFVTNIDSTVFAWIPASELSPEQTGALLSRYSRTSLTGRRLFLKEFLPNKNRGREFFEAWLVDYGDDSIQEMVGGIPLACEYVSQVAVKEIEDSRMGSYIEKSTRYVAFDKKMQNGEYMFYKDPNILKSRFGDEYLALMNDLFDSYSKNIEPMAKYLRDMNPLDSQGFRIGDKVVRISELDKGTEEKYGISEEDLRKSYDNATKANALDFVRDYLPMSTLTHVGISANARTYESMTIKMMTSPLAEARFIGNLIHEQLEKVVPSLVKRAGDKHGLDFQKFLREKSNETAFNVEQIVDKTFLQQNGEQVSFVDYTGMNSRDPNEAAEISVISAILYKNIEGCSMKQARDIARAMSKGEREKIISAYVGKRTNRRHKPGRAFENVDYLFDFMGRIGIYRDIQRHRIGTQERQNFTVKLGYNTRKEYEDVGIADDYKSKMARVIDLFNNIHQAMPYQAQYAVTFGFNIRWYYRLNARQLFHVCELRSTPGGHPDYRKVVKEAYLKVKDVHPSIAKYMSFMDLNDTMLGRLNSEIRIAQKKKELGSKK